MKSSLLKKLVVGTFLSVPAVSSIISTIHLIDLFNMGNPTWLSILLAVTFELGSIASLLAISVIERIKVGAIWFIFFILSALQIIGNVYYSYNFTSNEILSNPTFLANFMDLFSFIIGEEIRDAKIFLSCIIGIPIPLIALFFLKSNIDYLKPQKKEEDRSDEINLSSVNDNNETAKKEPSINKKKNSEEISHPLPEQSIAPEKENEEHTQIVEQDSLTSPVEEISPDEDNGHSNVIEEKPLEKRQYKTRMIGNNIIKY